MRSSKQLLVLGLLAVGLIGATHAHRALLAESDSTKKDIDVSKDGSLKSPWFCHNLDCPRFVVVATYGEDIELRSYEAGYWASTNVSDVKYDAAVRTGFTRLFAYISGANVDGKRIEMTAPVRVKLIPADGPFCKDEFTVSFFVPFAFQSSPPEPLENDVFIDFTPASKYYVLGYGGFTSETDILTRATDMLHALDGEGAEYNAEVYFSAGYDPPFRLIGRHNEIWIPAK